MATAQASSEPELAFPPKGALRRFAFPKLVREIARGKVTGSLYLLNGQTKKVVFFEEGQPVFVRSNVLSECLGQVLSGEGLITQEQCEQTLEAIRRTGKKQGELLVEMGILSEGNLRYGLAAQLRTKLYDIFAWDDGRYQFKADAPSNQFGVRLDARPEAVIIGAILDRYDEERAEKLMGDSMERYLVYGEDAPLDVAELNLLPEERYFVECIDGSRTVAQCVRDELAQTVPSPHALVYGLVQAGVVELAESALESRPRPPEPNNERPTDESLAPSFDPQNVVTEYEDTPLPGELPKMRGLLGDHEDDFADVEALQTGTGISPFPDEAGAPSGTTPQVSEELVAAEPDQVEETFDVADMDPVPTETDLPSLDTTDPGSEAVVPPPMMDQAAQAAQAAQADQADQADEPELEAAPEPEPLDEPAAAADEPPPVEPAAEATPGEPSGSADEDELVDPLAGLELDDLDAEPELVEIDEEPDPEPPPDLGALEPEPEPVQPEPEPEPEPLDDVLELEEVDEIDELEEIEVDGLDADAPLADEPSEPPMMDLDPSEDPGATRADPLPPLAVNRDLGTATPLKPDPEPEPAFDLDPDASLEPDDDLDDFAVDDDLLLGNDGGADELLPVDDLDDIDLGGDDDLAIDDDLALDPEAPLENDGGGDSLVGLDELDDVDLALDDGSANYSNGPEATFQEDQDPEMVGAMRFNEAETALGEQRFPDAVSLLESAYDNGFDVAELHAMLAYARFMAAGQDLETAQHAFELLDYAESMDPSLDLVWAYRGSLHHSLGDDGQARSSLQRALELNPYCELAIQVMDQL